MLGKTVTIICEHGWKYTGTLIDMDATLITKPSWFHLQTKTSQIMVQASRAIAIICKNNETA